MHKSSIIDASNFALRSCRPRRSPRTAIGTRRCGRSSPGATARRGRSGALGSSTASMTPSGAVAVDDQPVAERLDRLMMPAVHRAARRPSIRSSRAAVDSSESFATQTSCASVERRRAAGRPACARARRAARVGMSCTSVPPRATFSTWMPRQIAKHRQVGVERAPDQLDLVLVAARLRRVERRDARAAP